MSKKTGQPRYVTEDVFERNMAAIMNSFQRIEVKFDSVITYMTGEFQSIRGELKEMREELHDTNMHLSRHDRQLRNHEDRIQKLES